LAVLQVIRPVTALSQALSWVALLAAQLPKGKKCANNSVPKSKRGVPSLPK
jgi:hypothetical protein